MKQSAVFFRVSVLLWYNEHLVFSLEENEHVLTNYIQAVMRSAVYEIMPDGGAYYGEVPVCNGVCATAEDLASCREQLQEVLEEWILLRIHKNPPVPDSSGVRLAIVEVS